MVGIAAAVAMVSGCASAVLGGYGQGGRETDGRSYAESREDNQLTARVNTLLVQDRTLAAMSINVSTRNRMVTLSGDVPSRNAASKAERLAASVNGVSAVDNRLRIRP
jgi:osmotically-inducible protein OsmY